MNTATLTAAPTRTTTWELDRGRCAAEVSLALPGATIWRARLRPVTARLTGPDGPADTVTLTATLFPRPIMTSLPLSRFLFLRRTPRTTQLRLTAQGETGEPARLIGEIVLGARAWPIRLVLRRTPIDDARVLVAVAGRVVRPMTTFPGAVVDVEAVAEFVRCD